METSPADHSVPTTLCRPRRPLLTHPEERGGHSVARFSPRCAFGPPRGEARCALEHLLGPLPAGGAVRRASWREEHVD